MASSRFKKILVGLDLNGNIIKNFAVGTSHSANDPVGALYFADGKVYLKIASDDSWVPLGRAYTSKDNGLITVDNASGEIYHNDITAPTQTEPTRTTSLDFGSTVVLANGVTTDGKGHITALNLIKVQLPTFPSITKATVGLGNVDNTSDQTKATGATNPIAIAIKEAKDLATTANNKADGKTTSYVFDTKSDMDEWIRTNSSTLKVGDNLFIKATDVPDYWWNGTGVSVLETTKVDLTGYVTSSDLNDLAYAYDTAIAGKAKKLSSSDSGKLYGVDTNGDSKAVAKSANATASTVAERNANGYLMASSPSLSGSGNGDALINKTKLKQALTPTMTTTTWYRDSDNGAVKYGNIHASVSNVVGDVKVLYSDGTNREEVEALIKYSVSNGATTATIYLTLPSTMNADNIYLFYNTPLESI